MILSIITISKNNYSGLKKTLDSVSLQTDDKYEYIVIDGASTDGSASLLEEYDGIIDIGISEPDSGIYNAMNKGVNLSSGEYLLFLNSGDTLATNDVVDIINHHSLNSDIIIGAVNLIHNNQIIKRGHTVSGAVTLFNLFLTGIPHQGTLTKRQLLLNNPFDENYRINSDFKFFLETIILQNKSVQYIPELVITNYDTNGISSTNEVSQKNERLKIYTELIPERIRSDYDKVFSHYYEVTRVSWLLKHKFFYQVYRYWCTLGRKISE